MGAPAFTSGKGSAYGPQQQEYSQNLQNWPRPHEYESLNLIQQVVSSYSQGVTEVEGVTEVPLSNRVLRWIKDNW